MANDQLKLLLKKCRCCLQNAKESERLEIGEIIREKFFEVVQFSLSYSSELSQIICSTCFSILSQFSAMKKSFIENQNMLHDLLKRKEQNELYVKVVLIGEQHHNESKSENQKKKIESLYRVEEAVDDIKKSEHDAIESNEIKQTQFFCESCNKEFKSNILLKAHIKRIHLKPKSHHKIKDVDDVSKYLCPQCGVSFKKSSSLKRHVDIVHDKIKRFECDKCNYKCYKKESIKKHISIHLPQDERNLFKCHQCPDKLFSSVYSLKLHEKNFHKLSQKKFQCTYQNCERSFSREISLKEHVKFVHLKCRPMSCDQCELSFANKNHLKRHKERKHKTSINSNNLLV